MTNRPPITRFRAQGRNSRGELQVRGQMRRIGLSDGVNRNSIFGAVGYRLANPPRAITWLRRHSTPTSKLYTLVVSLSETELKRDNCGVRIVERVASAARPPERLSPRGDPSECSSRDSTVGVINGALLRTYTHTRCFRCDTRVRLRVPSPSSTTSETFSSGDSFQIHNRSRR